jgi:hypothetical protein
MAENELLLFAIDLLLLNAGAAIYLHNNYLKVPPFFY